VKSERDLTAVGSRRLSERLRAMREEIPGLTQEGLAGVFGGKVSMVSMYETARRIPPERRLTAYARLFATTRSFAQAPPHLIAPEDLTDEERQRFHELERDLLDLRDEASRTDDGLRSSPVPRRRVFLFKDGVPITVICADVPKAEQPSHASSTNLNYVRAASFADLDAVIDVFGHLRAENPGEDVRIRAATELKAPGLGGHLVLIGGRYLNEATRWLSDQVGLPVQQRTVENEELFVVEGDPEEPEFRYKRGDDDLLVEDVGLFVRTPNPHAPAYTLTICSGITTRGVRGAVQCFADRELRGRNERYLATRFRDQTSFGLMFKVAVLPMSGESLAPDLSKPETRLFEWVDDKVEPG
jgi:transcriptional regulator with XRE-family HTH domain